MGFCFYNNVVLAALSLLQQGLERILIFDWVRLACLFAGGSSVSGVSAASCLKCGSLC